MWICCPAKSNHEHFAPIPFLDDFLDNVDAVLDAVVDVAHPVGTRMWCALDIFASGT